MSNLGQIVTQGRINISQTDTTNTDYSDVNLKGFANEGIRFLGALVKKPIDHVEIQVQQDYAGYTLPNDAILLNTAYFGDVTIPGDVRPLSIVSEEALVGVRPNWMDQSVSSQGRPTRIVLIDRVTVLVDPRPNAAEGVSGKKIHLGYVYQPGILTQDSDVPDLPVVYHDLIADYIQYKCYMGKIKEKNQEAPGVLDELMKKAKKLEPLIIKESTSFGFSFGGSIDPNNDSDLGIRVY